MALDLTESNELALVPHKKYRPITREALIRVVCMDENPSDLVQMLFSREELLWLKKNLRT
jgi:hypothetical protein